MSSFRPIWLAWFAVCTCLKCKPSHPSAQWTEEADSVIGDYQAALQSELMDAMKQGGPARAIQVCNTEAPQISSRVAKEKSSNLTVRRTALRVRNPDNRPNSLEARGLRAIQNRLAAGEAPDKVRWHERDGDEFVYMRPIMTGALCTTCHGQTTSIPPEVRKELSRLYPNDQATGFSIGELRGAFVVTGPAQSN